jgi:predicted nucleic acid-binding Zn ribbon protein
MPISTAQDGSGRVRTPAPAVVPSCAACGAPLGKDGAAPKPGQKACSGRCRARLHREARRGQDAEVRRLLEAALQVLDRGRA